MSQMANVSTGNCLFFWEMAIVVTGILLQWQISQWHKSTWQKSWEAIFQMAFGIPGKNHKWQMFNWHFGTWHSEQEAFVQLASGSNGKWEWQMSQWQKATGMWAHTLGMCGTSS